MAGEHVLYRFASGLEIRTEVFHKRDTLRILPLGSPQFALMNRLANRPETVRGKRVFEPFAGSGPLGLMALSLGAAHVDFLDINPRAAGFHRDNAARSGLPAEGFTSITGDIAGFRPERPYDLLLANPPFVPTPDGLEGTLTSAGGPEGNDLVRVLAERLPELLAPGGEAFVYVFQIDVAGRPRVAELLSPVAARRPISLIPSQERAIPFEIYCEAYRKLFPAYGDAIDAWRRDLLARHGADLTLRHYVVHVGPEGEGKGCVIREDFAHEFGAAFFIPSDVPEELAVGRVFENLVPTG